MNAIISASSTKHFSRLQLVDTSTKDVGRNAQKVFDELLKKNYDPVIFGVTDADYETLSVNQAKILQLVRQQKAVIVAYEEYYERQNLHITEHNKSSYEDENQTEDLARKKGDVETGDESLFEGLWSWRPWK